MAAAFEMSSQDSPRGLQKVIKGAFQVAKQEIPKESVKATALTAFISTAEIYATNKWDTSNAGEKKQLGRLVSYFQNNGDDVRSFAHDAMVGREYVYMFNFYFLVLLSLPFLQNSSLPLSLSNLLTLSICPCMNEIHA